MAGPATAGRTEPGPAVAYLDPISLKCPGCARTGEIVFVVGIGPNTQRGQGPAYVTLKNPGPWRVEEITARPFFAGRLVCPDCGAEVLNRPENRHR
jgi:hypothetical protein